MDDFIEGSKLDEELVKDKMKTQEDVAEEFSEEVETPKEEKEINFMDMLDNPIAKSLLGGCKDMFKKEKSDPNICEISIKAPSEVVLRLFGV